MLLCSILNFNYMKTIKTLVLISTIMLGMTTNVFASWWNPTTWGWFKKNVVVQQVLTAPGSEMYSTQQDSKKEEKENWKTYTNFQHGYQISHPKTWSVSSDLNTSSNELDATIKNENGFQMNILTRFSDKTLSQYLADYDRKSTIVGDVKELNVAGLQFFQRKEVALVPGWDNIVTYLKRNNVITIFIISGRFKPTQKDIDLYNQIISTFKNIPLSAKTINDWETYKNEKKGYSISYPDSYHVAFENDLFNFDENKYERGNSNGVKIQVQLDFDKSSLNFKDPSMKPVSLGNIKYVSKGELGPGGEFDVYFALSENSKSFYRILVWGKENDPINIPKVLSTFKLIDRSPVEKVLGNKKLGGCYTSEGENIYCTISEMGHDVKRQLINADIKTFEFLGTHYAKDKNNVYDYSNKIVEAKPETFKLLKGKNYSQYAKDDKYVYKDGDIMIGVDVNSFEILNSRYTKDKNHVYSWGKAISYADPYTFSVFGESSFTKDKYNIYWAGKVITGADIGTFEVIDVSGSGFYSKDKNYIYHNDTVISTLKTYTNIRAGYAVQYPSVWEVGEVDKVPVRIFNPKAQGKPDTDQPSEGVTLGYYYDIPCKASNWNIGFGLVNYKTGCVKDEARFSMYMVAFSEEAKNIEDAILTSYTRNIVIPEISK